MCLFSRFRVFRSVHFHGYILYYYFYYYFLGENCRISADFETLKRLQMDEMKVHIIRMVEP